MEGASTMFPSLLLATPERPEGAWFRVNVGREKNADPKWLLPMLCRRGHVQKRDIGRFDIKARETRFEVNPTKAEAFEDSAALPDDKDPKIRIERV
jgi:ATP-dependent RNA helicase DeaD